MESIIEPVKKDLLLAELTRATELTEASRGDIKVYSIDASFPSLLREIGRLREIAFRSGGGGTGKECDVDRFDLDPNLGFKQLVVWDDALQCIVGGYRIIFGKDVRLNGKGQPDIPASHIFKFSKKFIHEDLPHTMELSRSFIAEQYQRTNAARKSIFILDCLFKAICVVCRDSGITDIFGKVTFYQDYSPRAFALITAFMKKHCKADRSIVPTPAYRVKLPKEAGGILAGDSLKANLRALIANLAQHGEYLPPILKSYLNLTSTIKYYGSAVNDSFGNVVEMGMKLHVPDLDSERWALYFK